MLARGVYLPPSAYEVCFLSLAHTPADLEVFAGALRESLAEIAMTRTPKSTRVFQLTTLMLVLISVVQVGAWIIDQRNIAIETARQSPASVLAGSRCRAGAARCRAVAGARAATAAARAR